MASNSEGGQYEVASSNGVEAKRLVETVLCEKRKSGTKDG
jgi:hypothetical protein